MDSPDNTMPIERGHKPKPMKKKTLRSKNENRNSRGLTCANCRMRKMRCGGGQPTCKTCEIYGDDCRYDKPPPMSQIMTMARRLQEAEETIKNLRAQLNSSSCEESQDNPSPSRAATSPRNAPTTTDFSPPPTTDAISLHGVTAAQEHSNFHASSQSLAGTNTFSDASREHLPSDLSVDENGDIQYYGPTSAVHDPPQLQLDSPLSHVSSKTPCVSSRNEIQIALINHAQESTMWEDFALGNASLQTGIPRQIMAKLLNMHWTWVSPMFMYIYRPAFIRDMATEGRYYSEFLLTVICAHAAKYQDNNCAEFLLSRVYRLLGAAIQQPSSIPTVQALLQLSARELANGSISQAWVYSGIAFRMASDLGLQYNSPDISSLGPVDLEIRRRLFWSCYFWDKATSLYAGRLPAVNEALPPSTLDQLDDSMELEMWAPYYGDSASFAKLTQNQYSPQASHAVSCFANSCKLSIIINDIVFQLYSRKNQTVTESAVRDIKARLDHWRAESPLHLRYEADSLPSVSPPPHIISQNLLYHTTVILANRPFWSVPAYYDACIAAAQAMEKLVLLLESTFGLDNITYLMGYCIYTGASAVLEDAKSSHQGIAHPVLRTFLRALNTGMRRCPLLERSLNIIAKSLNRVLPVQNHRLPSGTNDQSQHNATLTQDIAQAHINQYIPAFPYLEPEMAFDFNMNSHSGDYNPNSITSLNSFPEMWLDNGEVVCSFNDPQRAGMLI